MHEFLKKHSHRLTNGWFWAAMLLVLPACSFSSPEASPGLNLPKGADPHDAAIFCDIEKTDGRRCATPLDKAMGIRLADAAVALAEGRTSGVGLDDSPAALARCNGEPEAVLFEGPFPQGLPICLNCSSIATKFGGDNNAACRAACYDLYGPLDSAGNIVPDNPPTAEVQAFCDANARPSTNFAATGCISGACRPEGVVHPDFADPRRNAEPVIWQDLINVAAGGGLGSDLSRTTPTSGDFDAGAVSAQWIQRGDAWMEFSVKAGFSQIIGLRDVPSGCPAPCPDTNTHWHPINHALFMRDNGPFFILEGATQVQGPGPEGSFGTYVEGERFRLRVRDNGNGTATVRYTRVVGSCTPGTVCTENDIFTSPAVAHYPLRVDTSLYHQGATITDVRLTRIQ
jgi:hypothetical protein